MTLQDRDYQTGAVDALFQYLFDKPTGNPVIAMPTGTGKSVVIGRACERAYRMHPRVRAIVCTHVKELIQQNYAKLLQIWPGAPAGVYSAGLKKRDVNAAITFAGVASIAKRPEHFGHIDILFIDEAHLVSPSDTTMYQKLIDALRKVNPYLRVVALTATPWRLGHGHIAGEGSIFTEVCFDLTTMDCFNWLLDEGYLCPLVPQPTDVKLDVDGVHMRGGEFIAGELDKAVNQDPKTRAALTEAVRLASDRYSWLAFCAGADHSRRTAAMLRDEFNIGAEAVYDSMAEDAAAIRARWPGMLKGDRDEVIDWWKQGRIRVLTNNNILTTGIDHPALDCILILRPTASTVLWVQMLGRGTRPYYAPGYDLNTRDGRLQAIATSHKPNCLVLDFARNTPRLGPINDPVIPRRKGEKVGEAPVKICNSCGTYNHASARHCFFCSAEFPVYGPKIVEAAGTEDLIKKPEPVSYDIRVLAVDHVTYALHTKLGKPPSVKVSYFCGLRRFQEYIGFEHQDSFSRRRARDWWEQRSLIHPQPATTTAALSLTDQLKAPTHLRVWINKKPHPDILAACFDGTAFGEQQDDGQRPDVAPAVVTGLGVPLSSVPADMEDDIPF